MKPLRLEIHDIVTYFHWFCLLILSLIFRFNVSFIIIRIPNFLHLSNSIFFLYISHPTISLETTKQVSLVFGNHPLSFLYKWHCLGISALNTEEDMSIFYDWKRECECHLVRGFVGDDAVIVEQHDHPLRHVL